MVILVTGLCSTNCFYCPLSFKKTGVDRIYADEWELDNEHDTNTLIQEAENIQATGAGITGGDPLIVWQRTKTYIALLKEHFGTSFHIHLYTSALKNPQHLSDLVTAGLDEVRFHPLPHTWSSMQRSPLKKTIQSMVDASVDVAIEIPVLPKTENDILSLISWADHEDVDYINLNELEFSEHNCDEFLKKGYQVRNAISAAVKGSQETATTVLRKAQKENLTIGVHYCSVSFKDGVQLKNRLIRRAHHIATPYDVITNEGTLIKGVIYPKDHSLASLLSVLQKTQMIPSHLFRLDYEKERIEIAAWMLEKIAPSLAKQGYHCFIVEEYPTADRLEVERTPVPTR